MVNLDIQQVEGGIVFGVKVIPDSSRTAFAGRLGSMVKVKVAAAAEKGKANQCLIEFLAKQFGVKRNAVSIVSGSRSPVKQVQIKGISAEALGQFPDLK